MKKLETMTIKEIELEIQLNDEKRREVLDEIAPLEKVISRLYNRNKKLEDQIAKIKAKQKTDWAWLLSESGNDGMEKYHLREQKLRELGLRSSGYFREIEQVQLQVMLIKNDPKSLPATMKGLKKLLKYIKPFNGYKTIDIFEHTCSEYGVWTLLIDENKNEYNIQLTCYHRPEIKHKLDNLKSALEKIQDKYFYSNVAKEDSYGEQEEEYNY